MIAVLADDFSGAAEVAGVAFEHALSAEVHVGALQRSSSSEVIVIDTDTRSCDPTTAALRINHVCQAIAAARPTHLFKKTDSLLRGPVLAELNAMCACLSMRRCLLVNANPRKGRCVRNGHMFIDQRPLNQTQFASDPEHPRTSSSLKTLLADDSHFVSISTHHDALPLTGVVLGDAVSADDLHEHARRVDTQTLPGGGAEFFEALLKIWRNASPTKIRAPLELCCETLIVCGSAVSHFRALACLSERERTAIFAEANAGECARITCEQLTRSGMAILTNSQEPIVTPSTSSEPNRLHQQLIRSAALTLSQCRPAHVWIEGGRTASSLVKACEWERLVVEAVHGDGVIRLRSLSNDSPTIVVKPGSYPWPTVKRMF